MKLFNTDKAPAAIGPYSQAVIVNGMIYTSGQIPLVPGTGEMITNDIERATAQVMENLQAILEAAGSSFEKVIKVGIFLKDMNDFANVNAVYEKHLDGHKPARSTIEVARLPKDAQVEIDMVALI